VQAKFPDFAVTKKQRFFNSLVKEAKRRRENRERAGPRERTLPLTDGPD
jgi:hypothetical protein